MKRLLFASFALTFLTTAAAQATTNWTQLFPAASPSARSYVAMAYDPASKMVVLFGGFGGTGYLNDTWTFDGVTWTKVETAAAPDPRTNAQMAYDRRARQVVLFGGARALALRNSFTS